jgi:hypothetical protein
MFKIGEKVRIKRGSGERYRRSQMSEEENAISYVHPDMAKWEGDIVTINGIGYHSFRLKERPYSWHQNWLESLSKFPQKYIDRMKNA